MGYRNRGGTFDAFGMLYANQCTWGHIVARAGEAIGHSAEELLDSEQFDAVQGRGDPESPLVPEKPQLHAVGSQNR
jgi:phosphoketolase